MDERFMRVALGEAKKGEGRTSPNPAVGAVIVRLGRIVARGHHRGAGLAHAEIEAIRAMTRPAQCRGATLYVTLEPCSTHGRTPPCTDAIVGAGFARVVFGATDPNPKHAGRASRILRAAGVEVSSGVLAEKCAAINRAFNHWITTGRPWVIAKCAMSLDGRLTRRPGEASWITRPAARRHAQALRARVDAILVGAATIRADNPRLTVRGIRVARQPWRVVLTRSGRVPKNSHVLSDAHRARTLVFRGWRLHRVLVELAARDVTSVMIEGGGDILGQAFDQQLVNEIQFYYAPLLLGGPVAAVGGLGVGSNEDRIRLVEPAWQRIGPDLCLTGRVAASSRREEGRIRRAGSPGTNPEVTFPAE
jgi:diaminohydroxyphosphoribosylaminopyrimidine deaminase / 5-amino-6-(5-phosphoribosylamino)uracil reductase